MHGFSDSSSTTPSDNLPAAQTRNTPANPKSSRRQQPNPESPESTVNYVGHSAIPISFILHVCLLLAATSRAFPTAHGTPAISLFLVQMEYCKGDVARQRVIGGCIGAVLGLLYYYIWYVWPGRTQTEIPERFISSAIVARPAFLYSELQIPDSMIKVNDAKGSFKQKLGV